MLETAHIPLIGIILNEVAGRSSYYTYYGYGESSYREPDRKKAVHRKEHSATMPLSSLNGYTRDNGDNPPHGVQAPQAAIYEHGKWRTMADQSESSE